jgi:hypothetical protein
MKLLALRAVLKMCQRLGFKAYMSSDNDKTHLEWYEACRPIYDFPRDVVVEHDFKFAEPSEKK